MAKIKKAQRGAGVPKGYVRGEMTGRLIPEKEYEARQNAMAKELNAMKEQWKKDTTKPAPKKAAVAPKKKMKSGGKLAKQAAIAISMKKKGIKPKMEKAKGGKEMIKRADGSYSQRGLWDNIRANKGSGKKPTAQMLKQEKKIKAASKKK
jgi:hypothetical protein